MNLTRYMKERQGLVDRMLRAVLAPSAGKPPRALDRAMRYSLFSGGKRIRPILALASAEALGADLEPVLPFACGLEMIHAYSLVHDDLPAMDDDELRRGKPTNHVAFGEGMAILAGDGLLTEAFRVMAEGALAAPRRGQAALRALCEVAAAAGASGMVGGQVLDLEAEKKKPTRAIVEAIHTRKTGAMIRAAVRVGALLGGATPRQYERLDRYGTAIGLAFQVTDDILDIEGGTEKTGKRQGRDAELHKATYPAAIGLDRAKRLAGELREDALAALEPFGPTAEPLRQLCHHIVNRAVPAQT